MRFSLAFLSVLALFTAACSSTPTPEPPTLAAVTVATAAPSTETPRAPVPPSLTPNVFGLDIIAQFNPTTNVLTIYGTTPGATIVLGGTPLMPPPTATASNTPEATSTPRPTSTRPPVVIAPPPPQPTRPPAAPAVTQASLRGKIMFKSTRDGGIFPNAYSLYAMNPDGSGVARLEQISARALYLSIQSREGFSPDGSRVVLGERQCFGTGTCGIYILDTTLDAALINSNDDISHGDWFVQRGYQAKDPVWSPNSDYIAFFSNHEADPGCLKTLNLFKGTPGQKPVFRRLTSGPDFCGGGNGGHPSFNGAGSQIAFWGEGSGTKQIYVLNVGADNSLDYRYANQHIISDGRADDWDPLWVK